MKLPGKTVVVILVATLNVAHGAEPVSGSVASAKPKVIFSKQAAEKR